MGTIAGIRLADGIALTADRRATAGGAVRTEHLEKLFDYDDAGAAVTGEPSAIQEFSRRLDDEIRQLRTRQTAVRISALERLASEIAAETGAEALVAVRDGDGIARLRAIDPEGGATGDDALARGTGAQLALGQLDGADLTIEIRNARELLESVFDAIAERDAETGDEIDVWTLEDS